MDYFSISFKRILYCAIFLIVCVSMAFAANVPQGIHPVLDASSGFLFGGTINGKWIDGEKMVRRVPGGEKYRLYSFAKYVGTVTGSKARIEDNLPSSAPMVSFTPPLKETDKQIIGICGVWNALPRIPKDQSTKQTVYRNAVADVLKQHGLPGAPVHITRLVRIDLEGDGKDEVLISATTPRPRYPDPSPRKNDYSIVILRKLINGRVVTTLLAGEFYQKNEDFAAPQQFTIDAILDVNGDGVMEPILGWCYYEGAGKLIYQIQGGKAVAVLECGCGA